MRMIAATMGLLLATSAAGAQAQTEPAPAQQATSPEIAIGAKVYDTKGSEVGTIESVATGTVVVSTGTQKATLPKTAIAQWPKGLVIAMTQAELNDAAAKATQQDAAANAQAAQEREAALQAALVPGAQAHSFGGSEMLGTVKAIEGEVVTFTAASGDVALPRSAFIMGTAGLSLRMTAEQFATAIQQAGPKANSPAS